MTTWDNVMEWFNDNVVKGFKDGNTVVIVAVSLMSLLILSSCFGAACCLYNCYKCCCRKK